MSLQCPRCGANVERAGTMCDNCNYFLPLDTGSEAAPDAARGAGPASGLLDHVRTLTLERPAGRSSRSPSWLRGRFLVIAVALICLGATGAAASALPVLPLGPDKSVAAMLPASTAAYISADLNPTGVTRANLVRLQHAFTSQPGWRNVQRTYASETTGRSSQSTCYHDITGGPGQQLHVLGHDTTLALIGTKGINASGASDPTTAVQRQTVLLAPLNVRVPLIERLLGIGFSLTQQRTTYRGVTIYKQRFPSCGKVAVGTPDTYYAALYRGYVVAGLLPDPIERIIDTDVDRAPTLAGNARYEALVRRLPANSLGSYYLSGPALRKLGPARTPGLGSSLGSLSGTALSGALQSSAGSVGVEPDGVKLTFAGYGSGHPSTLSAGQAASILPSDVLADISFGDAPSLLRSWVQEAEAGGIWNAATRREVDRAVSDITSHMKGEADIVLFRSPRAMHFGSPSNYNAPLALMWPVSGDAAALQGLDNAVTSLHEGKEFIKLTTPDGTVARQATGTQGGYAVRHGWAVLSLDIGPTIDSLSHVSGQTLATAPGYRAALPAGGKAASVWYVNTDDLRQDLETAILPTEPRAMVSSYRQEALPILAPFRAIAGSASGSTGPNITVSTFNVRITATP